LFADLIAVWLVCSFACWLVCTSTKQQAKKAKKEREEKNKNNKRNGWLLAFWLAKVKRD